MNELDTSPTLPEKGMASPCITSAEGQEGQQHTQPGAPFALTGRGSEETRTLCLLEELTQDGQGLRYVTSFKARLSPATWRTLAPLLSG
ncbi:hypothetical protein [Deinococcus peraridilitoris]|uniref:Uncharacterized protein n=1 Tax=Deinococcus peraridilitoris (strain DSM 19664 / LMG 22246 / CIP 109416 / KR-200) TaxID=937777 RepID=L0A4E6_DEIPD|nr:hypothetical protein [Deinococcus peraridilitoris]AFZ67900.1 hypothetical protein Deipe_2426 [Deinococcus peraridilitoris DSM 19664]